MLIFVATTSYWLLLNGLHAEEPLLVATLPEGQTLPSYMVLLEQLGVLVTAVYVAFHHLTTWRPAEWYLVGASLVIALLIALPLAFMWDVTTEIAGQPHSIALFAMILLLGVISNLATVIYPALMAHFKPHYISALYLGQGISTMVTGVAGLVQGVGDTICFNVSTTAWSNNSVVRNTSNTTGGVTYYHSEVVHTDPLFSVTVYFVVLTVILCISTIAFAFVYFSPYYRQEWWKDYQDNIAAHNKIQPEAAPISSPKQQPKNKFLDITPKRATTFNEKKNKSPSNSSSPPIIWPGSQLTPMKRIWWFFVSFWYGSVIKSVPNSINSYIFLPYGTTTYGVAVRGAYVAKTAAAASVLFIRLRNYKIIVPMLFVVSSVEVFFLYLASTSPTPILSGQIVGSIMVIILQYSLLGFGNFIYTTGAAVLREKGDRGALMWYGTFTMAGKFISAIVLFVLINVVKVFQSVDQCKMYVPLKEE